MDGIQPYVAPPRAPVPALALTPVDPTQVKVPADYLRALRRRIWLVLAIGVPLSVLVAVVAMKQRSVYRATAEITIEPPQFDSILSTLVSQDVGARDSEFLSRYIPNKIAVLRSHALADEVLKEPDLAQNSAAGEEAVREIVDNLQTRQVPNSSRFQVSLEGTDPARTKKLLETLLDFFVSKAKKQIDESNEDSKSEAVDSLNTLKKELAALDEEITQTLANSKTIGPGGKSLADESYLTKNSELTHKKVRLGEVRQQAMLGQMFPGLRSQNQGDPKIEGRIWELEHVREKLTGQMQEIRRRVRNFNNDPSSLHTASQLKQVIETIERLKSVPVDVPTDPSETVFAQMSEEIRADEETVKTLLKELQESMPVHHAFLNKLAERQQKFERIRAMEDKLWNFKVLSRSQAQKSPVKIDQLVTEPSVPVRPNRLLNIVLGVIISFGLGIGLVCLLENLDHSVKVPEHLSMGLTLPLFGVIPRIRRTALIHRGGHLWTPGMPESIEADAYRNLRASLIGSTARHGPIVTLLVTSAKAGEGKSTTALNLAATCARAGERTLLMDVDLRRPSLAGVFRADDDEPDIGLVDVLRGDLPWQRTVARTDIPNLDFLPTGDTREIPIEVLGTIELRQLIIAVAHHYDRVILDGPAVLGLPDCRLLGPFVDAALLVVRSGSHELRPLKRAKAFLEQSNVVLAGVVFNGLYEDLENWSSYGPNTPYGYPEITGGEARTAGHAGGLDAPSDEPRAAFPTAGSARA